jgi:hypothetical protein
MSTVDPVVTPAADASVIARRQNIAKTGKVPDFRERLILFRKPEQVPIGIRHHHVFGLSADPSAKIDVAVGATRPARIHVEADVGMALLTIAASSARDVEWHRDHVAFADEFNAAAAFDDFAGNLVPEDQSGRRSCAPAHHMLIAAADVSRDRLDDDAVVDFPALRRLQLGVVDALHLDFARSEIDHSVIGSHLIFSFAVLLFESKLTTCFSYNLWPSAWSTRFSSRRD